MRAKSERLPHRQVPGAPSFDFFYRRVGKHEPKLVTPKAVARTAGAGCPRSLASGDRGQHEPHASEKRASAPPPGAGCPILRFFLSKGGKARTQTSHAEGSCPHRRCRVPRPRNFLVSAANVSPRPGAPGPSLLGTRDLPLQRIPPPPQLPLGHLARPPLATNWGRILCKKTTKIAKKRTF